MKSAELALTLTAALGLISFPQSGAAEPSAADVLRASDGSTDDRRIAAALDALRRAGPRAAGAAGVVTALLPHHARVYRERDKALVLRLRAYVFATLGDIGVPDAALPMLLDAVAHIDERMGAIEVGAAVRAVGTLGPRGAGFARYLLSALNERFAEDEFSLERYAPEFPDNEATTVQLEAVRALGRITEPSNREVLEALDRLRALGPDLDARVHLAIDEATRAIHGRSAPRRTP